MTLIASSTSSQNGEYEKRMNSTSVRSPTSAKEFSIAVSDGEKTLGNTSSSEYHLHLKDEGVDNVGQKPVSSKWQQSRTGRGLRYIVRRLPCLSQSWNLTTDQPAQIGQSAVVKAI